MTGQNIQDSVRTLRLFLQSLPTSVTFNIISFGSDFTSLFQSPQSLTEESLRVHCYINRCSLQESHHLSMQEARSLLDIMKADMGGTELLGPLKHIFSSSPKQGFSRNIFVLTDGEVY